jgi:hypothetical protein
MISRAKLLFDSHLEECREAIALYEHFEKTSIYRADFNLRFVWIAAVSALDHYVSQLILERATKAYANNEALTAKLLSDGVSLSSALELRGANSVDAILIFRRILSECIRYKSFQHPDKIADGLSYVWAEKHKWQYIAGVLGISLDHLKGTMENIVDRRNLIAHNADYDEARGEKLPVDKLQALEVVKFLASIADVIELEVSK